MTRRECSRTIISAIVLVGFLWIGAIVLAFIGRH